MTSVFGKCTLDIIQTCPEGMFILLVHLSFNNKSQKYLVKKNAVDAIEYGKQNPQAAFENGTLRNSENLNGKLSQRLGDFLLE